MSKTLKNTLAGLTVAALLLVGAGSAKAATIAELQAMIAQLTSQLAALSGGSSCSAYNHTVKLMVGSKGSQVMAMQAIVGANADGNFGPMTKAKVQAFQASKGLTADGIVGAMTGAALHNAGCTTTGGNDDNNNNNDNSSLDGDFGTISDVSTLSQYNNEEVGDGENDVKVAGFEVEAANDGDIMLTSMKLTFDPSGNGGSSHLDDYVDGVKIWMGSKEIGSADVSDFTKNSNDTYSKTISLDNSIVRADETEKFYISVDAVNNLDSGDISSDSWTVDVDNIRYEDGSGVVTTDVDTGDINAMNIPMNFVDFGTAANTELKISTDSDSPEAGVVVVDDQDNTDGVTLLKGRVELEGTSDVIIDEFPVTLTSTLVTNVDQATGSLTLIIDGEEYTESVSGTLGASTTITFNNMDFALSAGDTVDFEVKADINDIETGLFEEGDNLKADVTTTNRSAIDAENEEGDQLSDSSEKSGTAVGEYQEFRTAGIALELVSTDTSVTVGNSTNDDLGTFKIKFKVSAVGDTAYIGTTVTQGYTYTADLAGTTSTAGISAVVTNLGTNGNSATATTQGNWRVEEGTSTTIELTVQRVEGTPLPSSGLWRASLTGVKWSNSDGDTTLENTYSSNMNDFKTSYISLN